MNNDTSSFLLINVGAPFLIGLSVGYFIKKTLKIGLFLLGMSVVVLLVSKSYGLIDINGQHLTNTVQQGTGSINEFGSFLMDSLVGLGGVGLSGGAGFIVGLKVG